MGKLSTMLTSLDEVDESLHDFYQENERGEFVLQIDGVDDHPTVRGLTSALNAAKKQRRDAREALAQFQPLLDAIGEDGDIDNTVHELVARLGSDDGSDDAEARRADVEARVAARMKALESRFTRDLEKAQGRATRLETALHDRLVNGELDAALEKAGVRQELRPAVRALMKEKGPKVLELGEGEFKGVFATDIHGVPEANQPIADYVTEWARSDGALHYIEPSGNEGSGAPPSRGSGGPPGSKRYTSDQLASGDFDIDALAEGKATVVG